MLQYAGLIAPIHGDTYELTTAGQLYLEGEIDDRYRQWQTFQRVLSGAYPQPAMFSIELIEVDVIISSRIPSRVKSFGLAVAISVSCSVSSATS